MTSVYYYDHFEFDYDNEFNGVTSPDGMCYPLIPYNVSFYNNIVNTLNTTMNYLPSLSLPTMPELSKENFIFLLHLISYYSYYAFVSAFLLIHVYVYIMMFLYPCKNYIKTIKNYFVRNPNDKDGENEEENKRKKEEERRYRTNQIISRLKTELNKAKRQLGYRKFDSEKMLKNEGLEQSVTF